MKSQIIYSFYRVKEKTASIIHIFMHFITKFIRHAAKYLVWFICLLNIFLFGKYPFIDSFLKFLSYFKLIIIPINSSSSIWLLFFSLICCCKF